MNMRSRKFHPQLRLHQRGSAAVELALLLPVLTMFMAFTIFYASCVWHYTVAQKAAQDSARYLSQVSRAEMMSDDLTAAAVSIANQIVKLEMAELMPGSKVKSPDIICETMSGIHSCGFVSGELPTAVSVSVSVSMFDTFFHVVDTGRYGLKINAEARMAYVGK
jgi:hypothetical protein